MSAEAPFVSIIIPVFNSAPIIPNLCQALDKIRQRENWNLEVLMVDDGCHDGSFQVIKKMQSEHPQLGLRGFKLSRNFGQQNALCIGLSKCRGEYIAIIDDDMQDPPSLLPQFFSYLDKGFDVAYGVRRKRKEGYLKVTAYKYFYQLLHFLSDIDIPLDSGDFCVMKRSVVDAMLSLKERQPFLRGIRAWVGFRQVGVEYEREKRPEGETGYTLGKLFNFAFDGIFSFSTLPLRIISLFGLIGLMISFLYALYILGKYFLIGINAPGFVSIALLILFFGSLNLLALGIVGEYLGRIYAEGKNRPYAIVAEEI